jgi:hypothetical protein
VKSNALGGLNPDCGVVWGEWHLAECYQNDQQFWSRREYVGRAVLLLRRQKSFTFLKRFGCGKHK